MRVTKLLAVLALLVVAAGCRTIVVHEDGTLTSFARYRVVPTTVTVEGTELDAVEIQIRSCEGFEAPPGYAGLPFREVGARPVAAVRDAEGTVLFSNGSLQGPQPHGSTLVNGGEGQPDRIVVPVEGAPTPLTIGAGCTTYPGVGSVSFMGYDLEPCTTSDRTCAWVTEGQLVSGP